MLPARVQTGAADEVAKLREALEEALISPTPESLEEIRADAMRFCTLSKGRFPSGTPRKKLEEILDLIIVEPDAFDYARNELRGFFFSQLTVKYDDQLARRFCAAMDGVELGRFVSHRPSDVLEYREPESGISAKE